MRSVALCLALGGGGAVLLGVAAEASDSPLLSEARLGDVRAGDSWTGPKNKLFCQPKVAGSKCVTCTKIDTNVWRTCSDPAQEGTCNPTTNEASVCDSMDVTTSYPCDICLKCIGGCTGSSCSLGGVAYSIPGPTTLCK